MPRTPRHTIVTLVAATAAVIATGAALAPSAAAKGHHRPSSAVTVGNARFEVLSPTLIRTEYAGDAHFVDASTFNAIGRASFGPTAFTHRIRHGRLIIKTARMTLRYKIGSGPFDDANLTVTEHAGRQRVAGRPWAGKTPPTCTIGTLCEAEDLKLDGVSVATDHAGYTGRGFAAGFQNVGNNLSFQIDVADAGSYQFDARYANWQGGDGQTTTRTLTVSADGGPAHTLTMPVTGSWDTWQLASTTLDLAAGKHTITVERTASDSGNVNIDSLAVVTPGSAYPSPPPPATSECQFGTVCEAESGTHGGSASTATDHNDYSGAGFLAGLSQGASDTVHVVGVPGPSSSELQLRYATPLPPARGVGGRWGPARRPPSRCRRRAAGTPGASSRCRCRSRPAATTSPSVAPTRTAAV